MSKTPQNSGFHALVKRGYRRGERRLTEAVPRRLVFREGARGLRLRLVFFVAFLDAVFFAAAFLTAFFLPIVFAAALRVVLRAVLRTDFWLTALRLEGAFFAALRAAGRVLAVFFRADFFVAERRGLAARVALRADFFGFSGTCAGISFSAGAAFLTDATFTLGAAVRFVFSGAVVRATDVCEARAGAA